MKQTQFIRPTDLRESLETEFPLPLVTCQWNFLELIGGVDLRSA
jgi:hypothetical protein